MNRPNILGVVLLSCLVAGCYTLQPAAGFSPGTRVAFDVNDVGRVALGGAIGPEIGQIEGRLVSSENGEYLLAVSGVRFLRGGQQVWSGDRVRIKREYVGQTYERRFSRGRTIALTAAVVGGVAVVVLSRDLFGLGFGGRTNDPPIDTLPSLRIRRP